MAHTLRMKGILHRALTVPGYSLESGAPVIDWQHWRESTSVALAAQCPGDGPVILGGLCVGGMLAAAAALTAKRPIAGLVLMSPTFRFDGWGMSPIRHLRHIGYWTGLDRFFSVKEREPFGVKNEKIRGWIRQQMQDQAVSSVGPARIPLTALREAERMMRHVRAQLASLQCPVLIIHAREDEIATPASVQAHFDRMPQADKTLVFVDNSYHMITIDNDRQTVARLLAGFVDRVSEHYPGHRPATRQASAPTMGLQTLPSIDLHYATVSST